MPGRAEEQHPIKINRAPVLTLWAAVVAERLGFDWLGHFRRLVVRYEWLITTYAGFFHIACALLTEGFEMTSTRLREEPFLTDETKSHAQSITRLHRATPS